MGYFMTKKSIIVYNLLIIILTTSLLLSAPIKNFPTTVVQPNGDSLYCFLSGDEFYNWMHDADGYTIIQNQNTGYFVYADLISGKLVPTNYVPGKVSPKVIGLKVGINITSKEMELKREESYVMSPEGVSSAPTKGIINNIVIFIRFSNENEFTDLTSVYDDMFNNTSASSTSMYNYFRETSYNQLSINSTFYPISATNQVISFHFWHPRGYCQPYSATNTIGYTSISQRRAREQNLLQGAVTSVSSQIPPELNIDSDNNGIVDNVCFIVSGSPDGWNETLWPHKASLTIYPTYINGKLVNEYNLQMQNFVLSNKVDVLAHEMFHSLGAPDLYHYNNSSDPVGNWDIMDYNYPAHHMCAYMKWKYGKWISSIPEITTTGTYILNPLTSSTNNCFKISSLNSTSEYFVVEYRKRLGPFENTLPGEGLLVYRINKQISGNAAGPPDEVYLYRLGGTINSDGSLWAANYSANVGRTSINDLTNPSSFLSDGSPGRLDISNIGFVGNTIDFVVGENAFPVELTSFIAQLIKNKVSLNWQTATEINNYGFDIERITSDTWQKIGFVNGNGNSNSPKKYSFIDRNPTGGCNFKYRLKQIDNDGQFEYSDVVEVEIVPIKFSLYQNYPNPFNPKTIIKFSISTADKITLKIYNPLGAVVSTLIDEIKQPGNYNFTFDARYLPSGIYFYNLQSHEGSITKKMILLK